MKVKTRHKDPTFPLPPLATFATATLEAEAEYLDELLEETIDRIEEALEAGEITEDEAEELAAQAEDDYEERAEVIVEAYEAGEIESEADYEEEGEDGDDDEEGADYGAYTDLATFASATASPLAATLLGLGEDMGYDTVEDLVLDLADYTGLGEEDIAGLLTGEYVPDEELTGVLAEAFDLDDEEYDSLADIVDGTISDEIGDDDGEEEEGGGDYSRHIVGQQRQMNSLQDQIAEFQTIGAINTSLVDLEREARLGVDEGWLPPIARDAIMGNFEMNEDRVAAFSELCASNQVVPEVELYAMQKQLEVFRSMGPIWGQFGAAVEEPISEAEFQEYRAIESQARRNHNLRKERNGFGKQDRAKQTMGGDE